MQQALNSCRHASLPSATLSFKREHVIKQLPELQSNVWHSATLNMGNAVCYGWQPFQCRLPIPFSRMVLYWVDFARIWAMLRSCLLQDTIWMWRMQLWQLETARPCMHKTRGCCCSGHQDAAFGLLALAVVGVLWSHYTSSRSILCYFAQMSWNRSVRCSCSWHHCKAAMPHMHCLHS